MKEVTDYLARAKECREMAARALPEQKATLEEIARTWEKLAEERQRKISTPA
jgi:hypothetical protein